jgi:anti-sigma factor RsiW
MPSLPVTIFCKSAHCPASETLLAYRKSGMARGERAFVEAHLAACEFCSSELQLLDRYRYGAEEIVIGQIPAALRKLAEELLPRAMRGYSSIAVFETQHLSN